MRAGMVLNGGNHTVALRGRSAASEPALPAWVHEMVPDKPCGGFSTGLSTGACTVRAEVSDWMSLVAGGGGGTCQN